MFVKAGQDSWLARLDFEQRHAERELAAATDRHDQAHYRQALRDIAEARRHYGRTRLR